MRTSWQYCPHPNPNRRNTAWCPQVMGRQLHTVYSLKAYVGGGPDSHPVRPFSGALDRNTLENAVILKHNGKHFIGNRSRDSQPLY